MVDLDSIEQNNFDMESDKVASVDQNNIDMKSNKENFDVTKDKLSENNIA